jgi:hypothetical protein
MCFSDAELLRPRAHTHTHPNGRQARHRRRPRTRPPPGRHPFELRAALDDFELRGEPTSAVVDAASRIPTDSAFPELARAEAALKSSNPQLG